MVKELSLYEYNYFKIYSGLFYNLVYGLAIPFSSGPYSVRPLHHDPPILGCPAGIAWFHWIREGCSPSVIRLTSFLWVWFQCVCPLMPSCNTYHLTWVSLTLGVEYLFTAAPAKHSCCSLPWTRGISLPLLFLTFNVGWWEELTHWKRLWCWEGLGAGGQGDDRGWDG